MHDTWSALADASRRAMLRRLAPGELSAAEVADGLGLSQPGSSRHLKVLREAGLVTVRGEAQRRIYALDHTGLAEVEEFLALLSPDLGQRLDALHTEVARGQRTASSDSSREQTA